MGGSSEGDAASLGGNAADPERCGTWVKERVLGTGGFGTVTLWKNENSSETIALKKCRWGNSGVSLGLPDTLLSPELRDRWQKEVQIMMRLDHPCVVSCFPVPSELEGAPGDLPMLCMEYCSGGDLRRVLNKAENCCGLKESQVRRCLRDLTEAVAYLHSQRIIHRDLKPENIVLQDVDGQTRCKLIDLGYAKELEYTSVCTSFVGTLQYLAPELFLSKKYSCTVDYWSLGLVVHEIITGQRPFLPNMSPVEWMKRVRSKKTSHICVFEGSDGEIHFSEHMFAECHICAPFKAGVEQWLQLMLEWEPSRRGQVEGSAADEKKVVAFARMAELLNKKILRILVVSGCRLLEYELQPDTELTTVQTWVERDTGVPVDEQRLLLPRGQPPEAKHKAVQCWAPPEEDDDWLLFVFNTGAVTQQVTPRFPAVVEEMLRSPRALVEYSVQRRMYSHSLYFLQREALLLRTLNAAQRVAMLYLESCHAEVVRLGQRVLTDVAKLQARHHLFMEALNTDLDHYTSQPAHARISSEKAYGTWRAGGEATLSAVHAAVDKTQRLDAGLTALNTKMAELRSSPFTAGGGTADALDSLLSNCEDLLMTVKRRPRDERSRAHDCTAMCKLLLQALRKRDRVLDCLYTHIEKQASCLLEVQTIAGPLEELLQEIARAAHTISRLQQRRQEDIWKILTIVADHRKGISGGLPRSDLPRAAPPPQAFTNLSLLLQQSSEQDNHIIAENRALRCQMVELLSGSLETSLRFVGATNNSYLATDGALTAKNSGSTCSVPSESKLNQPPPLPQKESGMTKTALLEARRRVSAAHVPVETSL